MPRDHELEALAREAGFSVLALGDVFGDAEWLSLVVAPWDHHPNARGHAQIADTLFEALERGDPLHLGSR